MTDQLVQSYDLETWLGVTDPLPFDRSSLILQTATGWVQGYTRQRLVPVTNDVAQIRTRYATRELLLPERPVTAVASVTVDGVAYAVAGTDWTLWGDSLLTGAGKGRWSLWPEFVTVTYSHGYTQAPADVAGVVLSVAARITGNAEGYRSMTVGGVSYTYDDGAGAGGGLTESEKAILNRYRRLSVA